MTGWSDGRTFGGLVAEMEGKPREPVPRSDPEERMAYDTALTFLHQARLALEAGDKTAADAAHTAAEWCTAEPWLKADTSARTARGPQKRTRRTRAVRRRRCA